MAFTTPGTAVAGEVLTAAFWNTQVRDNLTELAPLFADWTSWTPQLDQGATTNIAKTVVYAKYLKVGRLAIVQCRLNVTGTGTAGGRVSVSMPAAVSPVSTGSTAGTFGYGQIFDSSAATSYLCGVRVESGDIVQFNGDWSLNNRWGETPSVAITNQDQIHFTLICETTS